MGNSDSKTTMMAHSKAKVNLYKRYLSAYLSILSRVSSVGTSLSLTFYAEKVSIRTTARAAHCCSGSCHQSIVYCRTKCTRDYPIF